MIRVAYICADPGVPVFGVKGCSIHVQEVARALVGLGTCVELFVAKAGGTVPPGLEGCAVHPLPWARGDDAAAREVALQQVNHAIDALLTPRTFDLVYERYSLWSYAAADWAKAHAIPYVLEVNAPLIEEQSRHRQLHDRNTALATAQRVFGGASAIVCVSAAVARYVESFGVPPQRVHVIPNGVNPARFPRRTTRANATDRFTVGFVGTLKPWHGLEVLLTGFDLLRRNCERARLLVVGDGPQQEALHRQAESLGLTSLVTFAGAVAPENVAGLLDTMDVGVAPCPPMDDFYFSPLKVFEYMAAGLPVVASDIGQVRDIVQDGQTGRLVPPGDPQALAGVLHELANDPSMCRRLGSSARQWVLANHTWEQIARRVLELAHCSSDHEASSMAAPS